MCVIFAHKVDNFVGESHSVFPQKLINTFDMIFLAILCALCWIGPALKDGANIK